MPLSSEDRLALDDLYARYCYYLDVDDSEGFGSTWTDDGVFRRPTASKQVGKAEEHHGMEALKKMCGQWSDNQLPSSERPRHQHWLNNIWFEDLGEGSVRGHASVILFETAGEDGTMITMGFYTDEVVKTPAGWKFKSREASLWF